MRVLDEVKKALSEIKAFFEYHDLSKLFPKYFSIYTKFLVYVWFLLSLFFVGLSISLDGVSGAYVSCPCNSVVSCENPLYSPFCLDVVCSVEYLSPCESLGQPPSFLTKHLLDLIFLLLVLFIVLNHLIYRCRKCQTKWF